MKPHAKNTVAIGDKVVTHNQMHITKPRITHTDLEDNFNNYIKQTPEYAIVNVGTNPFFLILHLFIPNSRNTIWDRCKRLIAEKFYIVYSDWLDKLSVVLSLASVITGLFVVAHAYSVGARKMYAFVNPNDTHDAYKTHELEKLNGIWSTRTWDVAKLVLAGGPCIIQLWRAFKRSSVPSAGNESIRVTKLEALTEKNRLNFRNNQVDIKGTAQTRRTAWNDTNMAKSERQFRPFISLKATDTDDASSETLPRIGPKERVANTVASTDEVGLDQDEWNNGSSEEEWDVDEPPPRPNTSQMDRHATRHFRRTSV